MAGTIYRYCHDWPGYPHVVKRVRHSIETCPLSYRTGKPGVCFSLRVKLKLSGFVRSVPGADNANLARELINNGNVGEVFNKTLPHFLITIIFIKLVCSDSSFTA